MDYESESLEGKLDDDDELIEDKEDIEDEGDEDEISEEENKPTASDIRRRIEDYLEKRTFLKELGEDLMDVDDMDWATE